MVATGGFHTLVLKSDGTAVAVSAGDGAGQPHYGQCDVGDWMHMV